MPNLDNQFRMKSSQNGFYLNGSHQKQIFLSGLTAGSLLHQPLKTVQIFKIIDGNSLNPEPAVIILEYVKKRMQIPG